MAEGFDPPTPFQVCRFQDRCHQPLGHLPLYQIDYEEEDAKDGTVRKVHYEGDVRRR